MRARALKDNCAIRLNTWIRQYRNNHEISFVPFCFRKNFWIAYNEKLVFTDKVNNIKQNNYNQNEYRWGVAFLFFKLQNMFHSKLSLCLVPHKLSLALSVEKKNPFPSLNAVYCYIICYQFWVSESSKVQYVPHKKYNREAHDPRNTRISWTHIFLFPFAYKSYAIIDVKTESSLSSDDAKSCSYTRFSAHSLEQRQ